MLIDLGNELEFTVKLKGAEYILREPTTREVRGYLGKMKDVDDDEAIEPFLDFVISLGMPNDVAEQLGFIQLKKLADGIMGGLTSEKK